MNRNKIVLIVIFQNKPRLCLNRCLKIEFEQNIFCLNLSSFISAGTFFSKMLPGFLVALDGFYYTSTITVGSLSGSVLVVGYFLK